MFIERAVRELLQADQSVELIAPPRRHEFVDVFNFYDWLGAQSPLAFVLLGDGYKYILAGVPKREVPNLHIPDLARFGTVEFSEIGKIPIGVSPTVRRFIERVNGGLFILRAENLKFLGRGPVLNSKASPPQPEREISTLEDSDAGLPRRFMAERPSQFQRVDNDCEVQ